MNLSHFLRSSPITSLILLSDIMGLVICFNLAYLLRVNSFVTSPLMLAALVTVTLICLYIFNTYTIETPNKALRVVSRTIIACTIAFLVAVFISFIIGRNAFIPIFGRTILFVALSTFIVWAGFIRYLVTRFSSASNKNPWLFIGNESLASQLKHDAQKHKHTGPLTLFIVEESDNPNRPYDKRQYQSLVNDSKVGVIIDSLNSLPQDISADLLQQRLSGRRIFSLTEFYSKQWTKIPIFHIGQQWLMDVDGFSLLEDSINYKLKRIFDFSSSLILGSLCLPLLLIIGFCVKLSSDGPVFYKQKRIGLRGNVFNLYKFRTMVVNAESDGPRWTVENDPRITNLGRHLRQSRLDELPQIYNVLLGQMSFIGPRPERPEFIADLESKIPYYDLRHLVKPGITGWAQVMYHYGASVEDAKEKLQYDLFYIKNQSLLLDALIILKTLRTILSAAGR